MKKILFIEDEAGLQKTLGNRLKKEGYEVISAFDGESGLKLAKEDKPDLILLDLILPKLDGFEILKELKRNINTKKILVIILTNLEQIGSIDKALKLGGTSYLVKANYSMEEIVTKIKKIIV